MRTKANFTTDFMVYGQITVPAGTKLTHKTAMGDDPKYHFVDDFGWIDRNYPEIAKMLKMDVISYGIDVPVKYVADYSANPDNKKYVMYQGKKVEVENSIDMTPTWLGLLPMQLELYVQFANKITKPKHNAQDEANYDNLRAEFKKMAIAADKWINHCKEIQADINSRRILVVEEEAECSYEEFIEANSHEGVCNIPDEDVQAIENLKAGEEVVLNYGSGGDFTIRRTA